MSGAVAGELAFFDWNTTYRETALFSDATVKLSPNFDIQFGARHSWIRQSYGEVDTGPYAEDFQGGSPAIFPKTVTHDKKFTYLVTPRLKLASGWMIYGRFAAGYRPGGPNSTAALFGLPLSYAPDTTTNYEIGVKGSVFGNKLFIDASLYHIDWRDIQISLVDAATSLTYNANGSKAKSQGAELSLTAKPWRGMTVTAWGSWNVAELTEPFPATASVYGVKGDRLPFTARYSGSLSAQQSFPLSGTLSGFVGGQVDYVGDRIGAFNAPPPATRQIYPSYVKVDLRAGIEAGPWSANIYANNLTNRRGVLTGGAASLFPYSFRYLSPRRVGLSVARTF